MAWGDSDLDTIDDACEVARRNLPAWKAQDVVSRLLDQTRHDRDGATIAAHDIIDNLGGLAR